jgi:P4 family phage/plasmid primase-like protien
LDKIALAKEKLEAAAAKPLEVSVPLKHQVKHTKLKSAVEVAQQRLEIAKKQLDKKPTDHNEYLKDCAEGKLLEAQNELDTLENQIEVDEIAQDEKTQRSDAEADEISAGLIEHLGVEKYEESVRRYGDPLEQTQRGWALNDAWWGAVALQDRTILYSPSYSEFYEYHANNGLWTPITENKLTSELHTLLVTLNKKIFKKASILKNVDEKFRHEAIKAQRGFMEDKEAFIQKKPQHVQVQNGVLNFTGGEITLQPHSLHYYSLYASPLSYDPLAKCPEFLTNMAHVPDDINLIQRAGGMFLLGRNVAQKIFLFEGKGRTRKTTIAKVFQLILGVDAVTQLRTEFLNERFEMFRIYQKSLLIGSDVPADFLLHDGASALKRMTGGDPNTAERKGSNRGFEFNGDLNVLITANSQLLLKLQTDTEAWKGRLVLVIFPSIQNAPAQRENYWNYLVQKEGAGILAWMVEGANQVLKDLAEGREFVLTDVQKARVNSRIEESDALDVFLTTCVTGDVGSRSDIATEDLVAAFGKFCLSRGWKQPLGATKQLPEAMARLFGVAPSQHAHKAGNLNFEVRGYLGVGWKDTPIEEGDTPKTNGDSVPLVDIARRFR